MGFHRSYTATALLQRSSLLVQYSEAAAGAGHVGDRLLEASPIYLYYEVSLSCEFDLLLPDGRTKSSSG